MNFNVSEPYTCTKIDENAVRAWERDGVLRISGLIPLEWLDYLRRRVIEVLGTAPEDPAVWSSLPSSPLKSLGRDKRCVALEVDSVKEAVNSVIGEGWEYPQTGGGWFADGPRHLERQNASKIDLAPRGSWHWDGRPDLHAIHGLWLFTPVIEMRPHSGGTWFVAGSARQVIDFYTGLSSEKRGKPTKVVKKWFAETHEWFRVLNGGDTLNQAEDEDDVVRLLNVAGKPGDVVMMKNLTVHSGPEYIGPGARLCQVVVAAHRQDENGNKILA